MSVQIKGPINPRQLQAALGGTGALRIAGEVDPMETEADVEFSSDQYTDDEISAAAASITFDPAWQPEETP